MRTLYQKKRNRARAAAALIATSGILLGGSVLGGRGHLISLAADTASQLSLRGEAIGALVIPAKLREEKPVRVHDKRTVSKTAVMVEIDETHEERTEPEQEPEPILRYQGEYKITGYDICVSCCGNTNGVTASGTQATVGRTCAAGRDLPFGTVLYIDGIGYRTVEDRGGGVNGGHIDVLCNDHPECYSITGTYPVYVVEAVECSEN